MAKFCTRCGMPLTAAGTCGRCVPPVTTAADARPAAPVSPTASAVHLDSRAGVRLRLAVALCAVGILVSGSAGPLGSVALAAPVLAALAVLGLTVFAPAVLPQRLNNYPRLSPARVEVVAVLVLLMLGTPRTLTWGFPALLAGIVLYAQRRLGAESQGRFAWRLLWAGWGNRTAACGLGAAVVALVLVPWVGRSETLTSYTYGGLFFRNRTNTPGLSSFDAGYALLIVPALTVAVCAYVYRPAQGSRPVSPLWPLGGATLAWVVAMVAAVRTAQQEEYLGGAFAAYGSYSKYAAPGPFLFCVLLLPFLWQAWRLLRSHRRRPPVVSR